MIKLFIDASKRMIYSYILLYTIILPGMFFFIPLYALLPWLAIAIVHIILRHLVIKKLSFSLEFDNTNVDKYLSFSIYISMCGGILWGSLGWLNLLYLPHEYHYIGMAVILGIAASAMASLSMIFISYLAFLLSMMFIHIIALLSTGDLDDLVILLMLIAYMIVIIPTAKLLFTRTKKSVELSEILKVSQAELSLLNETLEERVKEKTQALEYNYCHDELTGLPNLKKLSEIMEEGDDNYLILLDIKEFGLLNKQYGKTVADKILILISQHLNRNIRVNIELFRAESDRFIVYCKNTPLIEVEEYVNQIFSFFDLMSLDIDEFNIHINFTTGVSNITNKEESLIFAEYALTLAKKKGKRTFVYDITQEELQAEKEIISFLSRTKELILNEKLYPIFQPIYDINQEKIVKYECLARGDLRGEVMLPYQFLQGAKRLGLTTNITRIIIEKSFSFFKKNKMDFSINITEDDLLDIHFLDFLDMKLKRHKIEPERVTFEVLENITMHSDMVLNSLNSVKQRGCKIAVDDFGVENSSFSRLVQIDLDFIKIDGLFIKNININKKDKKVVQAIVGLAKQLGVKTIAEFVETEEILTVLKECKVDYAQGYYIGKPEDKLALGSEQIVSKVSETSETILV